jgi:hypothetical protein
VWEHTAKDALAEPQGTIAAATKGRATPVKDGADKPFTLDGHFNV